VPSLWAEVERRGSFREKGTRDGNAQRTALRHHQESRSRQHDRTTVQLEVRFRRCVCTILCQERTERTGNTWDDSEKMKPNYRNRYTVTRGRHSSLPMNYRPNQREGVQRGHIICCTKSEIVLTFVSFFSM